MIELTGVTKRYGDVTVLAPTDLLLEAGRTTALIGPSGCGKSTLLRLIVGLIRPDSGTVAVGGRAVTPDSAQEIRRGVGYVIQDGGLFPHLSARDNVGLLARYLGWNPARVDARVSELAELTRFPVDGLTRFPAGLSGGQRQRVGLMRALMLDPPLILMDEPLGALDPLVRAELQDDLREIFRTLKKTVVIVTHDLAEAAWFADEILLMKDGRIVQRGRLSDLIDRPADPYVTQFVRAQRRLAEAEA